MDKAQDEQPTIKQMLIVNLMMITLRSILFVTRSPRALPADVEQLS